MGDACLQARKNKCRREGKVLYIVILALPLVTSLPRAAKFPSDQPIECLQISAVQEACNAYAMKPRPLQFTCFISFVALGPSMELFYLTLYLYTHKRDYNAVFTI